MGRSILQQKSYDFALVAVLLGSKLREKREFILSEQFIRSATSVGANVEEALGSYSKKEFRHKVTIAYKEARETKYWNKLLRDTTWIPKREADDLLKNLEEILKIAASIIKTVKAYQQ